MSGDIGPFVLAELKARAAVLRAAAHKEEQLAYPLESASSRARRNRRRTHLLELSLEYGHIASAYEYQLHQPNTEDSK